MLRVLFVCTGNICRSPTAEGVLKAKVRERGLSHAFDIDSAGLIAYHVGEPPDPRACHTAKARDVDLSAQRARKLSMDDFSYFDFILAMDDEHLRRLKALAPAEHRDTARLFLSFHPSPPARQVPDPYYGGQDGFETTFSLIEEGAEAFLNYLEQEGYLEDVKPDSGVYSR